MNTAATEGQGFWASLADLFMPDEDRHTYTEGLNRGGYLLSARVPEELADTAGAVLESSDPIDLVSAARVGVKRGGQATRPASCPRPERSGHPVF